MEMVIIILLYTNKTKMTFKKHSNWLLYCVFHRLSRLDTTKSLQTARETTAIGEERDVSVLKT